MTAAAWITALAALFTAAGNGIAWIRHGRQDEARFADHGARIEVITALLGKTEDGPPEP